MNAVELRYDEEQVIMDDFDFVDLVQDKKGITRDQEVRGGFPVFNGTRIPADLVFDYIEDGGTIDDFLKVYDHIPKESVISVLKLARYFFIKNE